jgi:hypothetical protein
MRIRSLVAAVTVALAACGGGHPADTTSPTDPPSGYVDTYQRANHVADQLNDREAQLEQMVDDMGG